MSTMVMLIGWNISMPSVLQNPLSAQQEYSNYMLAARQY